MNKNLEHLFPENFPELIDIQNGYQTTSKLGDFYFYLPKVGLAVRVFSNGPGDLGSIPGRVIPKTQKMVLDVALLNTQHYKV